MCRDIGAGNPGSDGGRSNQSSERPGGGPGDYDLGGLGLDGEGTQKPELPVVPTGQASSASVGGGGGGGLPGGGGPQGYDGDPGGHGASGLNTDILHGVGGGGGGYTTSNVPLGGGGGGGFGPARGVAADEGDKFDLRNFLPGRRGAKGLHKVDGTSSRHPELAGPHDNIWHRVSAKYRELCQRGELYGCN